MSVAFGVERRWCMVCLPGHTASHSITQLMQAAPPSGIAVWQVVSGCH